LPVQKPEFINVSLPVDTLLSNNKSVVSQSSGEADSKAAEAEETNYQPISSKEEADFRRLLQKAELQIGQARQFSATLNEQLSHLDSANLSSIMENEQNVTELIELIDTAIELADSIEKQLDEYDTMLSVN
jgi:translation initiation factor 2B subunit (eIF-2B alpha/beta/delta family)